MEAVIVKFILFLFVIIGSQYVTAKPYRMKRFSDQHLADLETRVAMNTKYKGIAFTMPVGGGKYGVNPWKLGRKRRSEPKRVEELFKNEEEDEGDPVEGIPMSYDELLILAKIGLMSLRRENF